MIIVNREHHELLIAFYRDRWNRLPHGYFGTHRNHSVVYVTYDPNDTNITPRNKRILNLSSKDGQLFCRLVKEALEIENTINMLMNDWNAIYKSSPRNLTFPLRRNSASPLTAKFYREADSNCNSFPNKNIIDYHGHQLRSKNELILCKTLDRFGYDYKVEIEIKIDKFTTLYPDVTFYAPEMDKPIAIELDGAIDDQDYYTKSEQRKRQYLMHGFTELRDIIFFRNIDPYTIDIEQLEALIFGSLIVNIKSIIFP